MTRPLVASVAWLAVGQIVIGGLYWTFLHTPESNVWMLLASALLVVLMVLAASVAATAALDAWRGPVPWHATRRLWHPPAFLVALGVTAAIWWIAGRGDAWVTARSGEISAWFIATFNWADAQLFFRAVRALTFWVQWVAAPVAGLATLAALTGGEWRAWGRAPWRGLAAAPRRLALATLWIVVLVFLPLQILGWRMTGLPPTWVEPTVVAMRLMLVGLTATIGWALVCGTVTAALGGRKGPAPLVTSRDIR